VAASSDGFGVFVWMRACHVKRKYSAKSGVPEMQTFGVEPAGKSPIQSRGLLRNA
jgi:hypothetical protein